MQHIRAVTTSWDDGDPRDLRIAEVLRASKLSGTFYVPLTGYKGRTIPDSDLRDLCAGGFEIGAHGVSDRSLPGLSPKELQQEVQTSKRMLEDKSGHDIGMFCYPNGRYNAAVIRSVVDAGYRGARTTRMLSLSPRFPQFEMPTTVQAYPHHGAAYLKNQGRARSISGFAMCLGNLPRLQSWVELGKQLFDKVLRDGGVWHIYGHSWEIDQLGLWGDLQSMLDYVAHRSGVSYVTNGQLLAMMKRINDGSPETAEYVEAKNYHINSHGR